MSHISYNYLDASAHRKCRIHIFVENSAEIWLDIHLPFFFITFLSSLSLSLSLFVHVLNYIYAISLSFILSKLNSPSTPSRYQKDLNTMNHHKLWKWSVTVTGVTAVMIKLWSNTRFIRALWTEGMTLLFQVKRDVFSHLFFLTQ